MREFIKTMKGYTEIYPYDSNKGKKKEDQVFVLVTRKGFESMILEEFNYKNLVGLRKILLDLKEKYKKPVLAFDWQATDGPKESIRLPLNHKKIDQIVAAIEKVMN